MIEDCDIRANTGTGSGANGGLYATSAAVVVRRSAIVDNQAGQGSGGVRLFACAAPRFEDCEIAGNIGSNGGGFWISQCPQALLDNCAVQRNVSWAGGGIRCESGDLTANHCLITGNECRAGILDPGSGGGILVAHDARLALRYCTIAENFAEPWGTMPPLGDGICAGGLSAEQPNLELRGCIIARNRGGGGGDASEGHGRSATQTDRLRRNAHHAG